MKVKILTSIAGSNFSYGPREIVELEDNLARKWIKSGIAEAMKEIREIETATAEPVEKGVKKKVKKRKINKRGEKR